MTLNGAPVTLKTGLLREDNILYVPLEAVEKALSYTGEWDVEENTLSLLLQAAKREAFHTLMITGIRAVRQELRTREASAPAGHLLQSWRWKAGCFRKKI